MDDFNVHNREAMVRIAYSGAQLSAMSMVLDIITRGEEALGKILKERHGVDIANAGPTLMGKDNMELIKIVASLLSENVAVGRALRQLYVKVHENHFEGAEKIFPELEPKEYAIRVDIDCEPPEVRIHHIVDDISKIIKKED